MFIIHIVEIGYHAEWFYKQVVWAAGHALDAFLLSLKSPAAPRPGPVHVPPPVGSPAGVREDAAGADSVAAQAEQDLANLGARPAQDLSISMKIAEDLDACANAFWRNRKLVRYFFASRAAFGDQALGGGARLPVSVECKLIPALCKACLQSVGSRYIPSGTISVCTYTFCQSVCRW